MMTSLESLKLRCG